jgi:uncharacterized protein YneF (UPF0154 family)
MKKFFRKHKQKVVLAIAVIIILAMVMGAVAGFFMGL